jgi:hypothetical protein
MTDTEAKALALLNEVRSEYPFAADYHAIGIALNRAIEQHEAFKQEVSDALKKARGAINGLLDIASEENLDSEQAGRAYAALHEIGTALAAPVQATGQPHLEALTAENKRLREELQETRWVWERHKYNGEFTHFLEQHICAALDALGFEIREKGQ